MLTRVVSKLEHAVMLWFLCHSHWGKSRVASAVSFFKQVLGPWLSAALYDGKSWFWGTVYGVALRPF
jgi:hypothetical protein